MRARPHSLRCGRTRDQRPGGREHHRHDERGTEQEEEQVSQPEPAGALALGLGQVTQRGECELRWSTALEQVQERGERRGGEPQQRQRVEKAHVRRRSAIPKGMSVNTW